MITKAQSESFLQQKHKNPVQFTEYSYSLKTVTESSRTLSRTLEVPRVAFGLRKIQGKGSGWGVIQGQHTNPEP